jgi:peptidyl-prolyl cis-trans isomerase B (cyclophilin B)
MTQIKQLLLLFCILCSVGCNTTPSPEDTSDEPIVDTTPRQKVKISTTYGDMVFELFNETPLHRDNFIQLAKDNFYDSLMFHRVQKNFMIQGGDPTSRGIVNPEQVLGEGKLDYTIPPEINSKFVMRQGALVGFHDGVGRNPSKASNGAQFMVIHGQPLKAYQLQDIAEKNSMQYTPDQIMLYERYGGTPIMDGKYTIFGQLIKGQHVLDKIVHAKTLRMQDAKMPDRPVDDIRMQVEVLGLND